MTSTSYSILGIDMHRRATRRKLVLFTYLGAAVLCGLNVAYAHTVGFWPGIYVGLIIGLYIFGGNGRYGLIKSFTNKPPRPFDTTANPIIQLLHPALPARTDDRHWLNDERELARRNLAHYHAYQALTVLLLPIVLLAALALRPTPWIAPAFILKLLFAVALIAVVLSTTLPSAIILWTEPDIDTA